MKHNHQSYRKNRVREYLSIFTLFFPFFLVLSLVSSAIYLSSAKAKREGLLDQTVQSVIQSEENISALIQETYELTYNFITNDYNMRLLPSPRQTTAEETINAVSLVRNLGFLRRSLTADVYHVNLFSTAGTLINDSGRYGLAEYFDVLNPHQSGGADYWHSMIAGGPPLLLLPADVVSEKYNFQEKRTIVPLVVSREINGNRWLLVTEMQGSYFQKVLETEQVMDGQLLLCFDSGGNLIVNTTSHSFEQAEIEDLAHRADGGVHTDHDYLLAGQPVHLTIARCVEGVHVAILTPETVLNNAVQTDDNHRVMLTVFVLAMLLFFILTLFCTQRLYKPMKNVIQFVERIQGESGTAVAPSGIYNIQLNQANEMYARKDAMLYENLARGFHAVLCGGSDSLSLEESFLELHQLSEGEYGCMILHFDFQDAYYESFSAQEQETIDRSLPLILSGISGNKASCYVTEFARDFYLYIFRYNGGHGSFFQSARALLDVLETLFQQDSLYCSISCGLSQTHSGSGFLYPSIMEAVTALGFAPEDSGIALAQFSPEQVSYQPRFSFRERNALLSLMKGGDKEKALACVDEILVDNQELHLYEPLLQKVIAGIYDTGAEYIQTLSPSPVKGELSGLWEQPVTFPHAAASLKARQFIGQCMDLAAPEEAATINLDKVFEFITTNYSKELYLEVVAEHVSMSPKYLSRCFKEKMGINISEYINYVRITKAKELLVETDDNIADIGVAVGFENRTTFFRSFKKNEGISPNDYRKAFRK